jgi:hypothetical protein
MAGERLVEVWQGVAWGPDGGYVEVDAGLHPSPEDAGLVIEWTGDGVFRLVAPDGE